MKNRKMIPRHKLTLSERKEEKAGYLFLLPNLLGTTLLIWLPIVFTLLLGFTKWDIMQGFSGIKFVGLKNFIRLIGNERFIAAFKNNLVYTFTTVPLTVALSLLLASILNRAIYAKSLIRAMFFMPYISSMVAISVVWNVLLYPNGGPVNSVLSAIGFKTVPGWFTQQGWAMVGLIILAVWYQMGYYMIILLAGMQNVPLSLYEAAELDGAGSWMKFRHVTLPGISPTLFFVLIIATINSFKVFDQINIITKGGPGYSTTVLVYEIYRNAFYQYDFGMASAVSWILLLMVLIITMLQWIGQKKWVTY